MTPLEVLLCRWLHFRHTMVGGEYRRLVRIQIRELVAAIRHARTPIMFTRPFKRTA